ncbi:MAG: RluA family pseudouridine synthase [Victivallales bacterium]|nr:RluA family pseudouridine synthase [Victivallales bacterium]
MQIPADKIELVVDAAFSGKRLDIFLAASEPRISRSAFQRLIRSGCVAIDGTVCRDPKRKVATGEHTSAAIGSVAEKTTPPSPENIPLDILFEDEELLVLNKAPGIVVHPGDGVSSGTLVNALLGYFADSSNVDFPNGFEDASRPGIVHRLDKDTSGCLVVAKNSESLRFLQNTFKNRKVDKTYAAVAVGKMAGQCMLRDYIGRHPVNRKKMAVLMDGGKRAVTRYEVVSLGSANGVPLSLLKIDIETGRTHQIRVQLSAVGHPVAGDALYGGARRVTEAKRQKLHSLRIAFPHPKDSRRMVFEAPLPEDMRFFVNEFFPSGTAELL